MLKYQKKGLCKALSVLLAVVMILATPIGTTQAYALENEPHAVTDSGLDTEEKSGLEKPTPPSPEEATPSGVPLGTSSVQDSGTPPEQQRSTTAAAVTVDSRFLATVGQRDITIALQGSETFDGTNAKVVANWSVADADGNDLTIASILKTFNNAVVLTLQDPIPTASLTLTAEESVFATGGVGKQTYTVTAKAPIPSEGTASAATGGNTITVMLTTGEFAMTQNKSGWTLGGAAASGNPITGAAYVGSKEATITLTNPIQVGDVYTLTAAQEAFAHTMIAPFAVPLAVTIQSVPVCAIGGTEYVTLGEALEAVKTGETIKLMANINYNDSITISKAVTFDVGQYTLNIIATKYDYLTGLEVTGNVSLISTTGELNVTGSRIGVMVRNGEAASATVTNATATQPDGIGIHATSVQPQTSSVVVKGNVNAPHTGVYAYGSGSTITVRGYVNASGVGAEAESDANIVVYGGIKAESCGAKIVTEGRITVQKDITTTGADSTGAWIKEAGSVRIDGDITAVNYIKLGSTIKLKGDGVADPDLSGYTKYTDVNDRVVRVKGVVVPSDKVCEIGEKQYATLDEAIAAVQSGDRIKLLKNIDYPKGIAVTGKHIIFDVGPYKLNITNSSGSGLDVSGTAGRVSLSATTGELNVAGTDYAVTARDGGNAIVTNATASKDGGYGIFASGTGTSVNVKGNVQGTAEGVYITDGARVHVEGNVSDRSRGIEAVTCGARISNGGNVDIVGSVTVTGADGIGAYLLGTGKMIMSIDGTLVANNYIKIKDVIMSKESGVLDAGYVGYLKYADGYDRVVWVKASSAPTDKVCEIGEKQYATLDSALTAVKTAETIKLLQSITHHEPVVINGKSITFALGGFDLTIDTSGISNSTGLWVLGDGKVSCTGSGKLNVVGSDYGVRASGGSELHISGNVTARQYAVMAGSASGIGTPKVTVDGDVTVTGQDVNAWSEVEAVSVGGYATVTIGGNVTANRTDERQLVTAVYSNASTIVVGKNVTTQGSGVNDQNGGKVTIGGALHYNPTGSDDQAYIKVGYPVVAKTADDFEPTSIKPEYKEYKNGDNVVWVKEAPAFCTIGAQKFTSLNAAIASVPAGSTATITLLQSITHTKHIRVEKKTINLDLGDHNLLLDTSADGSYAPALMVIDGGKLNLIGSGTGEFNIKSHMTAISAVGLNTKATVHNVVAGDSTGVNMVGSGDYLDSSSTVTVLGSITVGNGNGVEVNAKNGKVVIGGNITAGRIGVDVWSNPGTQVTVNGDITVDGDSSIAGIWAYGATTVAVTGNVTVRGTSCVGVHASGSTIKVDGSVASSGKGAHSDTNGKVEITGSLTAGTPFITVGTTEKTAEQGTETGGGSLLYTDGANTVQIGSVGVPTPIYAITIQNDGNGTASANVNSAVQGEEITLTASANGGYRFKEWQIISGDVTVSGNKFTMPAGNVTIKAIFEATSAPSYTVTISGGGTGATGVGNYTEGTTVNIYAGNRSSYTFTGWTSSDVTLTNARNKTASFTMPGKAITVTANWSYNGGDGGGTGDGSGSSSGDSSNIIITQPAKDKPNTPTQAEIKVDGKVDTSGNLTVVITDKNATATINKAMAEAKKNGNEANGVTLVLHVSTGRKTVHNVTVNLPKTVQDIIISNKIVSTIVVVDNPNIKIDMDLSTIKEINKQANADVNITATRIDGGTLTDNAKTAIGNRPVFDLKANYGSGKAVQSFGTGSVSVTIPYTLGANEKAGNVQAVYVDAKGKVQWLVSSVYDSVNKVLRFSTNHFSTYGVGYKQDAPDFTDIANHWAKDDIQFVVNRGLFSGTSATTFSPNTAMTKGMFVTALGRLANADVSTYKQSSFTDVKNDAYYMGYIEWANKNNIVTGIGDGKFAPDQSITREQMAVIMSNYTKTISFTLPKVHAENTFTDNAKISVYAKAAVKQMQMAGVISGKNDNIFDPQGTATRAEVSAVLRRFVELAISSDTAQGWAMNDSGKWMYYENGKPVAGKKTIDGVAYTFDQYGVMADVPKNLKYTTYTVQKNDSFWLIVHKLGCTMSELERLNNKSRFDLIHPGDVLRVPEK